jgi:hypothetical protein
MQEWPDCFIPEDRDLGTQWISLVSPGGRLDVMPREKSLLLRASDTPCDHCAIRLVITLTELPNIHHIAEVQNQLLIYFIAPKGNRLLKTTIKSNIIFNLKRTFML